MYLFTHFVHFNMMGSSLQRWWHVVSSSSVTIFANACVLRKSCGDWNSTVAYGSANLLTRSSIVLHGGTIL
jgi:hypothetical protein